MSERVFIGCAGWGVASGRAEFASEQNSGASVLERYATRFNAVEINSSFYRPHRPATYARWAATTPPGFRFSAKVPKAVTHTAKLRDCAAPLAGFVEQVGHLGDRLVQLPPSLRFDTALAADFLGTLRQLTPAPVVCEPRHESWFTPEADALLSVHRVSQVAADPAIVPQAARPGGWEGLAYYRWHGSPRRYYSAYSEERLEGLAAEIQALDSDVWVIFDNTAGGEAVGNGLELIEKVHANWSH